MNRRRLLMLQSQRYRRLDLVVSRTCLCLLLVAPMLAGRSWRGDGCCGADSVRVRWFGSVLMGSLEQEDVESRYEALLQAEKSAVKKMVQDAMAPLEVVACSVLQCEILGGRDYQRIFAAWPLLIVAWGPSLSPGGIGEAFVLYSLCAPLSKCGRRSSCCLLKLEKLDAAALQVERSG